jgi:hypothetical protein
MEHALHIQAMKLAQTYKASEPALLETLMLMAEENLFTKMHLTGMWEYAFEVLGLSESRARLFSRIAQRARVIPELKTAVVTQQISLCQARRILGVIDGTNAGEWIHAARTLKQHDLERRVTEHSPRARVREGTQPLDKNLTTLTVVVTTEEEALLQRVKAIVSQKLGKPASFQQALIAMAETYLTKHDPVRKAERALAKSSRTSKGKSPTYDQNGRTPTPTLLTHQVHLRDGFRCTERLTNGQRCPNQTFLDIHHIRPVSQGGTHSIENLTTTCKAHHRGHHHAGGYIATSNQLLAQI